MKPRMTELARYLIEWEREESKTTWNKVRKAKGRTVPMSYVMERSGLKGLTAFQIKVIALICMTLDHLAAYGFEIPAIAEHTMALRTVGRIAAPLFLFILVQSIQHTRSKTKLMLRLYVAGACVGLLDTAMNFFVGEYMGYFMLGNILFTFFYIVLYVILLERMAMAVQRKKIRSFLKNGLLLLVSLVPSIFFTEIYGAIPTGSTLAQRFLFQGLRTSFLPSFYDVDYGIGLILLGVALYFAKTKKKQCGVFVAFWMVCVLGTFAVQWYPDLSFVSFFGFVSFFFNWLQCHMIFALPFMMLYNGERGRPCKWFFYWYYPLHRRLIMLLSLLLTT